MPGIKLQMLHLLRSPGRDGSQRHPPRPRSPQPGQGLCRRCQRPGSQMTSSEGSCRAENSRVLELYGISLGSVGIQRKRRSTMLLTMQIPTLLRPHRESPEEPNSVVLLRLTALRRERDSSRKCAPCRCGRRACLAPSGT